MPGLIGGGVLRRQVISGHAMRVNDNEPYALTAVVSDVEYMSSVSGWVNLPALEALESLVK